MIMADKAIAGVLVVLAVIQNTHAAAHAEGAIKLRGAGASFPYNVYKDWMPLFWSHRSDHVDVFMEYHAVGSGEGKKLIKGETPKIYYPIEYAGSDSLLKDADYAAHPDLQMLPTMAG